MDRDRVIKLIAYYNWLSGSKKGAVADYYEAERIYERITVIGSPILYYKSITDGSLCER